MLLHELRRLAVADDRRLVADAAHVDAQARAAATPHRRLLHALGSRARRNEPMVLVGRVAESGEDVLVPVRELVGTQRWNSGSTGSGKSVQVLAEMLCLVAPEAPWSLISVDAKSEMTPWLIETFIPATLAQWSPRACDRFFERYRVVNPFDPNNLPELNILSVAAADSHALHAKEIATLVTESIGTDGGNFGHRMMTILLYALRLALSIGGLSLLEVRSMLGNPGYLDGLLRFANDPELKEYFAFRFPKESRESIQAVISRLDLLLLLPDTSRSLCAKRWTIDFSSMLDDGVTLCDVGAPPRGAEYLSGFWQGVLFRNLARSIMGRRVSPDSRPVFAVMDEWWTGIDREIALHFERTLTLARFKKCALWLINQLPGQIGSRYPQLLATLKNSCGIQIAFRQSHEDASAMAYMLPVSERESAGLIIPRQAKGEADLRRRQVEELARLPERTFWFFCKRLGLEAVKLVSPTVDFDGARRAADLVSREIRDACGGKGVGVSRHMLDEVLAHRRFHIQAIAAGTANAAAPDFDRKPLELRSAARREPEREREPISMQQENHVVVTREPPSPSPEAEHTDLAESEDGFPFLG